LEFWRDHFLVWSEFSRYNTDHSIASPDEHKDKFMKDALEENLLMRKRIQQLENELQKMQDKLGSK